LKQFILLSFIVICLFSTFKVNSQSPGKEEVRCLLNQHTQDTGQVFSEEVLEKLYAYSGGQPWLTNALANEVVSEMLNNDYSREITLDLIEQAKERLIEQRQTHLDRLAEKIDDSQI
jgi:hypothetical protein